MRAGRGLRARPALALPLALLLAAGCRPGPAPGAAPPVAPAAEAPGPAAPAPLPATVAAYTEAQADRGREVFDAICSACHGVSEFRGQIFRVTWMARPVGDFFEHISTAMPEDAPGTLAPAQYAAVVAYVLQLNGHPAGASELPADARALEGMGWPR